MSKKTILKHIVTYTHLKFNGVDVAQTIYRFHYEHLFHDCKNKVKIVLSTNPDVIYSRKVAFLVRKHREALEWVHE